MQPRYLPWTYRIINASEVNPELHEAEGLKFMSLSQSGYY